MNSVTQLVNKYKKLKKEQERIAAVVWEINRKLKAEYEKNPKKCPDCQRILQWELCWSNRGFR